MGKQFGPPMLEINLHVIVSEMLKRLCIKELMEMGQRVRSSNTRVKRHGVRTNVLSKSAKTKKEELIGDNARRTTP